MSATKYCGEFLRLHNFTYNIRKYDHSVYLSSLFLPEPQRSLIWAIRAMNVELAHIQPKGNELGKIRFEWWKRSILELFEVTLDINV
jgi:phytoene/squalene synthetase